MSLFTCWLEDRETGHANVEASSVTLAACYFAERLDCTRTASVVVADEKARRWLVLVHPRIEYGAEPETRLSQDDLFPDDPMPTPEAERLRDEMAGGAK